MYLEHFGLVEFPFSLTPDTEFVFSNHDHQAALNTVLFAVGSGEGLIKITGEVGTGKTLLCRRMLKALDVGKYAVAYLPNPQIDARTLYLAIAEELGIGVAVDADPYHLLKALNEGFLAVARGERGVVLMIDEAQAMPLETLEAPRLLSNLETEKRKLVQLVIFGQPELDERLLDPSVRQIRQRISFHYRLGGLRRGEVEHYLAHRMRCAGARGEPVFSPRAARSIHYCSRGTPRVVNILGHKALLLAYGEGRHRIERRHVVAAARDTEGARHLGWWRW